MSTFKLQVHSRDLAVAVVGGIASHTGYDLVEYDDNGKALSIKSVDLVNKDGIIWFDIREKTCLLYTSPSPRDTERSRMPSSA